MAQSKKVEAGAPVDIKGGAAPEAAASAHGGIGTGRVVLLAKPSLSRAGYCPLALVALQDLPDDLRRQLAVGGGQAGSTAGPGGFEAPAPAPQRGDQSAAARYLLLEAGHPDVPDWLRRQLADVKEEDGKTVHQLDATQFPPVPENMDGLLDLKNRFPAWAERSGYLSSEPFLGRAHFVKSRAAVPGLGALDPTGLVSVSDNAVSFFGKSRAAEQGVFYSDGIVPPPGDVVAAAEPFLAACSSTDAVQVCADAAVGAKAGDPIAVGIKAAGANAGREHGHRGGGNLSAVVGVLVASLAVTAFTAGAASPAVAFGLFVILLGGLSLAMASVHAPY